MNKKDVKKTIQAALLLAFGYYPPISMINVSYYGIPYDVQQLAPLNAEEWLECDFAVGLRDYKILRSPLCSGGEGTTTIGYQYDLTIEDINGYGHDETVVLCDYFTDTSALDD